MKRLALLNPEEQFTTAILPNIEVLTFDINAAYIAGEIRADLEKIGQRLAWADIQIAAIAILHGMVLMTGNVKHFSRIPRLMIENPLYD